MPQTEYQRKLTTPDRAVEIIKSGQLVTHGAIMAEPPGLLQAIRRRLVSGKLDNIRLFTNLPLKHVGESLLTADLADQVQAMTCFVSTRDRGLVGVGLETFWPSHLHQVPRLITDHLDIDVMVVTVSPMNKAGYFSFGTANDYTTTAARKTKKLIVEVNENMPRVFGDSLLHISEVDLIVENHVPMLDLPPGQASPEDEQIGRLIAEMVPERACLQIGIGAVPDIVTGFLAEHRDLSIHTEVLGPGLVNLMKQGVVTNRYKSLHPRKTVFSIAMGDRDMLDYLDDNPAFESYPCSYTNDPAVIAQNDRMVSINTVLQVDLLGQCNAEFLNGRQYSGTGGQLDFVRGAYDAKGGLSILALRSTAKKGTVSRIVPRFDPGVMITTPRTDVHWLVTEYGRADVKALPVRERALAIIELAHPDFRDQLLREAEEMYLI